MIRVISLHLFALFLFLLRFHITFIPTETVRLTFHFHSFPFSSFSNLGAVSSSLCLFVWGVLLEISRVNLLAPGGWGILFLLDPMAAFGRAIPRFHASLLSADLNCVVQFKYSYEILCGDFAPNVEMSSRSVLWWGACFSFSDVIRWIEWRCCSRKDK